MALPTEANKLHRILRNGHKQKLSKGFFIQSSDQNVKLHLLASGYVKRYLIANDGSLSVQSIFGPGYIFPLTPVFNALLDQSLYSGPEVIYYETVVECEVYSLDISELKDFVEADIALYRDLFAEAGVRLEDNIQRLENLSLKSAYKRVAHQLAYFARHFGKKTAGGTKINLPLTHQDLADILNLTRETVSTSIIQLRKKKLVQTTKGIVVPDLSKLEAEAYS